MSIPLRTLPSSRETESEALYARLENISGNFDLPTEPGNNSDFQAPHQQADKAPGQDIQQQASSSWQPRYLRPDVLTLFIFIFALLAFTVEFLLLLSNGNQGLGHYHYNWTFVPTAVFTILAVFWGRVTFEAQLAAPWCRMMDGPADVKKSMLLDYHSMFPPLALLRAVKYRDWLVAIATAVSLVTQVLVILSTSLIGPGLIQFEDFSFPVTFNMEFAPKNFTDDDLFKNRPLLADAMFLGIVTNQLDYPDGTSPDFAWQRLSHSAPFGTELKATADGFSANLSCETGTLESFEFKPDIQRIAVMVETLECRISANLSLPFGDPRVTNGSSYYTRLEEVSCDTANSQNLDDRRALFIYTAVNLTWEAYIPTGPQYIFPIDVSMMNSTQILCKPNHEMHRVDIGQNATKKTVQLSDGDHPMVPDGLSPLVVLDHFFDSRTFQENIPSNRLTNIGGARIDTDTHLYYMFQMLLADKRRGLSITSLMDEEFLAEIFTEYYRRYAVQFASDIWAHPISQHSTGTLVSNRSRLFVFPLACHFSTGLLVLCSIASFACLCTRTVGTKIPLCHNSTRDIAMFFAGHPAVHELWRHSGCLAPDALMQQLSRFTYSVEGVGHEAPNEDAVLRFLTRARSTSSFSSVARSDLQHAKFINPTVLCPANRILTISVACGVIIALEITLHLSTLNNGLGNADVNGYLHYSWTTFPTVILGLLALNFSSVDVSIRALTPYLNMRRGAHGEQSVNVDLLNSIPPLAILRSIRTKNFAASAATTAAILAALFNVFTASLFEPANPTSRYNVTLRTSGSFNGEPHNGIYGYGYDVESDIFASIIQNNMSYPPFTFEDLLFPKYSLKVPDSTEGVFNVTLQATIPAIRPKLSCTIYDSSRVHTDLQLNKTMPYRNSGTSDQDNRFANPLLIDAIDERCTEGSSAPDYNGTIFDTRVGQFTPQHTVFGRWGHRPSLDTLETGNEVGQATQCSDPVVVWGGFSTDPMSVEATVMGCSSSLELVDAIVAFAGTDLHIISADAVEESARDIPRSAFHGDDETFGGGLAFQLWQVPLPVSQSNLLDRFMSIVTKGRYGIPEHHLANHTKIEEVAEAVRFHWRLLAVQTLNSRFRVPAEEANITLPNTAAPANQINDAYSHNAVMTEHSGRVRVMQNRLSTRALEALLVAVVLLSLVSWALEPRTNLLPRSPTTIANVAVLTTGGNLLEYLKKRQGSQRTETEDKVIFWLGWRSCRAAGEDHDGMRFGIWALTPEEFKVVKPGNEDGKDRSFEYGDVATDSMRLINNGEEVSRDRATQGDSR